MNALSGHNAYFLEIENLPKGGCVLRYESPQLGPGWLAFRAPSRVVATERIEEVQANLRDADEFAAKGGVVVGFLSYEAGQSFEPSLPLLGGSQTPLCWFGLFDVAPEFYRELAPVENLPALEATPAWSFDQYAPRFERVKRFLADGDCYQINLTFPYEFRWNGTGAELFSSRCGVSPPPHAAYINGGDWQVVSLSPELFFEMKADKILTRPMKGTAKAPASPADMEVARTALVGSPKTIAENIMIVDMVRNDLGRIARPGSVQSPRLLEVERHGEILQVTSTVEAETDGDVPDVFRALFPPGSVTGAPKLMSCQRIAELEAAPRGIYCGAIGFLSANESRFSVAIRTAVLDARGSGVFGVGGGLVWDSEVESEYEECRIKAGALLEGSQPWRLVEAIGRREDASDIDRHLERLLRSARELGIPLDEEAFQTAVAEFRRGSAEKLRISVDRLGKLTASEGPSDLKDGPLEAAVANRPVAAADPNWRYKTNSRSVLTSHLEAHPGFDEVLLYNESGLITEFCRGNALFEIGDELVTPDPACGCLPGVTVGRLVRGGKARYAEIPLTLGLQSHRVWLANAVVGLRPVTVKP